MTTPTRPTAPPSPGAWNRHLVPSTPRLRPVPGSGDFRTLGHRMVDLVADRQTRLRREPAAADRGGWAQLPPIPDRPAADPEALLEQLAADGLSDGFRLDHPRFFGYVPSPVDPAGVLADLLLSGFGPTAAVVRSAPGAHRIELDVIGWLRRGLGLPAGAGGLFLPGGSIANLSGLAAAVAGRDRAATVVLASDQTHSSVAKACRLLGVTYRTVSSAAAGSVSVPALTAAVVAERRVRPGGTVVLVANYGTTSTGAVDDLVALRRLADAHGLWLHVDGAYGLAAALAGSGLAAVPDSAVLDAHKWLFCPLETSALLVRDPRHLHRAFGTDLDAAPYLVDARTGAADAAAVDTAAVDPGDLGPQLSRQARAVRLWAVLQIRGADGVRAAVRRGMELARWAEAEIARSAHWEVVTPASLGVVTFAHRNGDDVTRAVAPLALADGYAAVSGTTVAGRPAVRMCTINPATTEADISSTLDRLAILASRVPEQHRHVA